MDALAYLKTCLGTNTIQSLDESDIAEIMEGFVVHQELQSIRMLLVKEKV
jgi:hypothetical protein